MDFQLLVTVGLIHSAALISPGPDFALMVKIATQQRRKVAFAAAFGISSAILVHTTLSLTGLSLIIHNSALLYTVIQLIGASYLGWLGFSALKSALTDQPLVVPLPANTAADKACPQNIPAAPLDLKTGFGKGLFTNLLNPKALVFFMTLFSALITPSATIATKASVAVILFSLSMLWFGLLAVVLSNQHIQAKFDRANKLVDGLIGLFFVSIASVILYQLILR